jgi:oligopeptide transport system substrate-binding protein
MRRTLLAALVLSLSFLAGCEGSDAQRASLRPPCPAGKLCLEYGNTTDPSTLDPQKFNGDWEQGIIGEMLIGLTDYDPQGRATPGMATHWEISTDGTVWTFHLRDALWSDGVPVTAGDFVAGFQRLFDPKTTAALASQYYWIKNAQPVNGGKLPVSAVGARAVDDKTFELRLEHPWPILPDYLNSASFAPIPRHVVAKVGDAWVKPGNYVANGPYRLVSTVLGDKVVLEKNPRYYDAAQICFDRVSFYPTSDTVSAERRVKSGELDLNNNVVSNRVARLRQPDQMPGYVHVFQHSGLLFLTFNTRDVRALKDVRIRQAISMAIDREFITNTLLRGGQVPAYTYVPPGMVDYDNSAKPYWAGWSLERRQAEARRLLAEAGYGSGKPPLKLEFKYRNSADPVLYMPSVQADMKAIGVQADIVMNETAVAYAAYDAKDFEVGEAGWGGGIDAYGFMYLHRIDTGSQNNSGYANPAYDSLLDRAKREGDLKQRSRYFGEAEQMLLNDAPIAPIYYLAKRWLVNPNITGFTENVVDVHKLRYMCLKDAAQRRAVAR